MAPTARSGSMALIDRPHEERSRRRSGSMNTYERRKQFEEFCRLKAIYRLRSDYDSTSTMSVAEVIGFAERLLDPSRRNREAKPTAPVSVRD
jgi:hypothetical protein